MMVLLSFQRIMLIIHNLFTLDGSGTFYGIGINTSITLGVEVYEIIPWAEVTNEENIGARPIDTKYY